MTTGVGQETAVEQLSWGRQQRTMATAFMVVILVEGTAWHLLFRNHFKTYAIADAMSLIALVGMGRARIAAGRRPHQLSLTTLTLDRGRGETLDVPLESIAGVGFEAIEARYGEAPGRLIWAPRGLETNAKLSLRQPVRDCTEIRFAVDDRASTDQIRARLTGR